VNDSRRRSPAFSTATHLGRVIDDLLDISRLEAGRLAVNPAAATIGRAIEAALGEVERAASEKGVVLSNATSGAAAELPYWRDETRVRQILVNLLSNAIKFTPATGRITVSGGTADTATHADATDAGPWVYVRVEDTGIGVPPERLHAIFEPFEQVRPIDSHRGAGLGLAISQRLARLMGGELTARSELGVGSEFALWLPVAASTEVPR
jgi:signal transduction histidine kinase